MNSYAIIKLTNIRSRTFRNVGVIMKVLISRKYYHFFGLKRFIVVATHRETNERHQYVAISRKAKTSIQSTKARLDEKNYDFTAYTETQYAHMLKLKY